MTRKNTLITLLLIIVSVAIACSKEKEGGAGGGNGNPDPSQIDCSSVNAQFAQDIFPLIQTRCATSGGCHGDGSINGPGALTSFQKIKDNTSRILNAVNSGRMPLGSSLNSTQINQLNCWVNSGAINN